MESDENSLNQSDVLEDEVLLNRSATSNYKRHEKTWLYSIPFILFGVAGTVPWNFMINANDFWEYKFRDVNKSLHTEPHGRTGLQSQFESFLSIASMIPNLIGALLCIWLSNSCRFRTHFKIFIPMVVVFILFLTLTSISQCNTDSWQLLFLTVILALVVVTNGLNSYGQCSIMGFAGTIGPRYVNSIMSGQAVGGVLASLGRIATLFINGSVAESSRYYFVSALLIIFFTIIIFLLLSRTHFYKFYVHKVEVSKLSINNDSISSSSTKSIWSVIIEIKLYATSIILVFVATLAVFPSVASLIVSVDSKDDSLWTGKLFVPLACFLIFNVGDLCGRTVANWVHLIPEHSSVLLIISIFRFLFIPLFMLCNIQPKHLMPLIFNNDWQFIILIATFAVSNGYLATISMMYAPKMFNDVQLQEMASFLMTLFMATGIALGSVCSILLVSLL